MLLDSWSSSSNGRFTLNRESLYKARLLKVAEWADGATDISGDIFLVLHGDHVVHYLEKGKWVHRVRQPVWSALLGHLRAAVNLMYQEVVHDGPPVMPLKDVKEAMALNEAKDALPTCEVKFEGVQQCAEVTSSMFSTFISALHSLLSGEPCMKSPQPFFYLQVGWARAAASIRSS